MKNVICLILCLVFTVLHAQIVDDFSDGDFDLNPGWEGNIDSFEVIGQQLHLLAPANTSESFLFTPSQGAVDGFWEFYVRMDFNPSSGNRTLVYLMSDSNDLQAPIHGYFVLLGNTEDEVSLYKQTGISSTKIIDGQDDLLDRSLNQLKVKVERDAVGNFTLFVDTSANLSGYQLQGSVFDDSYLSSNYFGVLCDYTSTRSDKFWFDDFEVTTQIYVNQSPPKLLMHEVTSLNRVNLYFNEVLDSTFAMQALNYLLLGNSTPDAVNYQNQQVTLTFNQGFLNNTSYTLKVQSKDIQGNLSDTTFQFILQDNYAFQSVIINEIYADETPSYGMPAYEFVEIRNISGDTIYLEDWKIADAIDTVNIPNDTIYPLGFLILCKTTAFNDYVSFGRCKGVPNFPSLNNTGDALKLFNKYDKIMDSLSYKTSWYANEVDDLGRAKKDGGYSLERISQASICSDLYNWFPSIHSSGASPGTSNSIINYAFPALDFFVEEVQIDNDTTLIVYLNNEAPFLNEQNISITNLGIEQAFSFNYREFFVLLDRALSLGNTYTISFTNVIDCRGNPVPDFSYEFYSFELPNKEDLVINEILFNPRTGGSDYLELYNKSDKLINLEGFQILEYDPLDPSTVMDQLVLAECIIQAHDYLVLTEDSTAIFSNYRVAFPEKIYQQALPNFADNESVVTLNFPDGSVIDSLVYHKSWHLELLDIQDGVSLERIDPIVSTNNPNNWQSASKTSGYGTPTSRNSQFFENDLAAKVSVLPEVFTPNEDGYKDFCLISYLEGQQGEIATITIYNLMGQEVKLIAQNHSLGQENIWKWNGLNNNFEKADVGIYIVLFEIFDLTGKKQRHQEKVVLGTPLN